MIRSRKPGSPAQRMFRLGLWLSLAAAAVFVAYVSAYFYYSRPPAGPWAVSESFESGTLGVLSRPGAMQTSRGHSMEVVPTPVRLGHHALRVRLDADDPLVRGNHRAEIRFPSARWGTRNDFAFSIFIPPDWRDDSTETIVAQWHSVPDRWLGEGYLPSPLHLSVSGGRWQLSSAWDERPVVRFMPSSGAPRHHEYPLSLPLEKGRWVDWSFRVRWAYDRGGSLEVRKDGNVVFEHSGPNTYNDVIAPYFKFGVYVPDWLGAERTLVATRVVYFDAIEVHQGY